MGKWNNRRWVPRRRYNNNKKYKDYDYEEPPPSPPSPHHSQSNPPVIQDVSASSWEIDFCKSVRVPWQKVVTAKKYLYCHENVVKWDDSAGEEAFHNAKRMYWEKINGLPCETPPPDQDMYIDEIDWNPNIDARLILDLDREYFNPNETESNEQSESIVKEVDNSDAGCNPGDNPWERGLFQSVDTLKGASSNWGQYDKSINLKNVNNPWEQSRSEAVESLNNNSWQRWADESLGWNQASKYNKHSSDANISWNHLNISGHESRRSGNTVNTWQSNFASQVGAPWNKGWIDWEEKQLNTNDSRSPSLSSCRKREGSFQHRSRYKTSRFQADDHGTPYQWQKEKSQKTVRFFV